VFSVVLLRLLRAERPRARASSTGLFVDEPRSIRVVVYRPLLRSQRDRHECILRATVPVLVSSRADRSQRLLTSTSATASSTHVATVGVIDSPRRDLQDRDVSGEFQTCPAERVENNSGYSKNRSGGTFKCRMSACHLRMPLASETTCFSHAARCCAPAAFRSSCRRYRTAEHVGRQ
jgi:hypothetical protein